MSMLRRWLAAFRDAFNGDTVTITRTTSRPMTKAEEEAFDRAFAKFDEGFDEIRRAFRK